MTIKQDSSINFDFNKYRVKSDKNENIIEQDTNTLYSEPFDFEKYKVPEEPTFLQEAGRHILRTGSRVAENILGYPGDVVSFVKKAAEYLPQGFQSEPNIVQKAGQYVLESLPTSESLKESSEKLTKGLTKSQGPVEEFTDEISSLASILINPSKALKSIPSFLTEVGKSIAKSTAVKSSGKIAKVYGGSENVQNSVELGTLLLTGLFGQKGADKFISEGYKNIRSEIPPGTMVSTNNLVNKLNAVEQSLSYGKPTNTKKIVKENLQDIKSKASSGSMLMDEIVEIYHDLNETMSSKKLFDELSTTEKKKLKYRFDQLKNTISEEIKDYGNYNPNFYEEWKALNTGKEAIEKSKVVSKFIESKLGKIPKHLVGSIALDLFLGSPISTVATIGTYGGIKSGELVARIAKSKKLRQYYSGVINDATKKNLPGVIKNLNSLEKELQKDQTDISK